MKSWFVHHLAISSSDYKRLLVGSNRKAHKAFPKSLKLLKIYDFSKFAVLSALTLLDNLRIISAYLRVAVIAYLRFLLELILF